MFVYSLHTHLDRLALRQYRASFRHLETNWATVSLGLWIMLERSTSPTLFFSFVLEMIEEGFLHVIPTGNGFWLEMHVPGPCGIRQGADELL